MLLLLRNPFLLAVFVSSGFVFAQTPPRKYATPVRSDAPQVATTEGSVWKMFGRNVVYQDLDEIDFASLDTKKAKPIPNKMSYRLKPMMIRDDSKLIEAIGRSCDALGLDRAKLASLEPREAMVRSIEITEKILNLYPNNEDPTDVEGLATLYLPSEERAYHERGVEEVMEKGLGDCDDYEAITIAVFRSMQKVNPKLVNVHVTDKKCGGTMVGHAYNSFLLVYEGRLVVTDLDAWMLENGRSMKGVRGRGRPFHVSDDPIQFRIDFYDDIGDHEGLGASLRDFLAESNDPADRKVAMLRLIDLERHQDHPSEIFLLQKAYFDEKLDQVRDSRARESDLYDTWFTLKEDYPELAKRFAKKLLEIDPQRANKASIEYFFPDLKEKD